MKAFLHIFKHDILLIYRNKIIAISLIVTALYVLIFKGLSTFGDMEKFLLLVIFNDPALLGFLFAGVMVLFEQNENTLVALAVTPIKTSNYVLSKSIVLASLSTLCCVAMVLATKSTLSVNWWLLVPAAMITTLIFAFLGFIIVAGEKNFNAFILKSVGIIILLSAPFLAYFDLAPRWPFYFFPTQVAIDLFEMSFHPTSITPFLMTYVLSAFWLIVLYSLAIKRIQKNFEG